MIFNDNAYFTNFLKEVLIELGDDPERDGLKGTPDRILNYWKDLTWSLRVPEEDFLKSITTTFDSSYDEMVTVKDIPLVSLCEHHFAIFTGHATVSYIPDYEKTKKVVGISKIARIVNYYSGRPQIQEKLTNQIAECLTKLCNPKGIGVYIEAEHTCMTCRGIKAHGSKTITTALRGCIKTKPDSRAEFLSFVKS